ncbi:MAG TPA: YebC/PmpR family DNA-binding transcriptional regulator [Candidatus Xenobia bacterium]|nr:YebC/PmpR family DNA-binding transcriptional regulator [Candidatus Xenobia bacterium]
MSGHSKWATIKHKKAATDARRGKVFSRLIKEITVAARTGGGDANANPRLRTAIAAARAENMPADNIERAIQRGTGQIPGLVIEEVTFEGYGPGGVAILVETATDNRTRTVNELRHLFSKWGGNLGESGSVAWMFHRKTVVTLPREAVKEEDLMELVLEAGADDLREDGATWEITGPPECLEPVKQALAARGLTPTTAEISMVPQSTVHLEGSQAQQMLRLLDALEEHDDVQHVYANFDIAEKEIEAAMAAS